MGHLGFTPQSIKEIGGYKIQGKTKEQEDKLIEAAKILEKTGVFSIVLEMIPAKLGKKISQKLKIPTIACGAGSSCDGQVLVTYDMLGLTSGKVPSFVKKYADLNSIISKAIRKYIQEINTCKFPGTKQSY